ncbi:MAG: hypothetical protein R3F28_12195 [Candidatus Kapaibacterium sp.]
MEKHMKPLSWNRTIPLQRAAICIVLCTGLISQQLHAQEVATVAFFLNQLVDKLNGAIDNAKNAGLSLEIQAGREAYLAIENAKHAYSEIANETLNRLDNITQQRLNKLKDIVDDVQNRTYDNLDKLASRVQTAVNALPFRPHEPQLSGSEPRSVTPGVTSYEVAIRCKGNFEYAAQKDLRPSLKVGESEYYPSAVSTEEITFLVPTSIINQAGSPASNGGPSYAIADLTIPWKTGGFLGLFKKRKNNTYKMILGVLPTTPGRIRLMHRVHGTNIEKRRFTSGKFYQSSAEDGGNDDKKNVPYSITPTSGWTLIRNTHSFDQIWSKGKWSQSFRGDDGNRLVYEVTTIHKVIGTSGQVQFSLSFDESRVVPTVSEEWEEIDLRWGDSRTFPFGTNDWKVVFDGFDGSHEEFVTSSATSKYLKINSTSTSVVISTVDPKAVVWP